MIRIVATLAALALATSIAATVAAQPTPTAPAPHLFEPETRPSGSGPVTAEGGGQPRWLRRPTGQVLGSVFPRRARHDHLGGHTTIRCRVDVTGRLADCAVVEETPAGYGFGDAGIQLSGHFQITPLTRGGHPVGDVSVEIPIGLCPPGWPCGAQPTHWEPRFIDPDALPPGSGPVVAADGEQPHWLRRPTGQNLAENYPNGAMENHIDGRMTVRCRIDLQGRLVDCIVIEEAPSGYGFGNAGIRLARYFQMTPLARDGHPVGDTRIDIPITIWIPPQ